MKDLNASFNQHVFELAWFNRFAPREETDCQRIAAVAKTYFGIDMLLSQARLMWHHHSEENSASWLVMPDTDDEVANIVAAFVKADMGDELTRITLTPPTDAEARQRANARLQTRCTRILRLLDTPKMPALVIEQECKLLHQALMLGYKDVLKPPTSESGDG